MLYMNVRGCKIGTTLVNRFVKFICQFARVCTLVHFHAMKYNTYINMCMQCFHVFFFFFVIVDDQFYFSLVASLFFLFLSSLSVPIELAGVLRAAILSVYSKQIVVDVVVDVVVEYMRTHTHALTHNEDVTTSTVSRSRRKSFIHAPMS